MGLGQKRLRWGLQVGARLPLSWGCHQQSPAPGLGGSMPCPGAACAQPEQPGGALHKETPRGHFCLLCSQVCSCLACSETGVETFFVRKGRLQLLVNLRCKNSTKQNVTSGNCDVLGLLPSNRAVEFIHRFLFIHMNFLYLYHNSTLNNLGYQGAALSWVFY